MLIDVSNHQGAINWKTTAPAIQGAYIKVTEGTGFVDSWWRSNHDAASGNHIPVGAYHFADLGNPLAEADHFADQYLTAAWQLRPVLDIETPGSTANWITAFRNQFRARTGSTAFRVYTNRSLLQGALSPAGWIDGSTDIWAAAYGSTLGWDHPALVLWQNTDAATVPGVLGNVDADQYMHGWTPTTDIGGDDLTPDQWAFIKNALTFNDQCNRTIINQLTGEPKGEPSYDQNMDWRDGFLPGFPSLFDGSMHTTADYTRLADLHSKNTEDQTKGLLDAIQKVATGEVDVSALAAALKDTLSAEIVKALGEKLAS